MRQKSFFNNIYHVMNIGVGDMVIFRNEEDKDYFCQLVQKNAQKHSITIYAYAIMDNHFHFCLRSPDFINISNFMRDVCAPYARYFNRTEITMKNNKPTKRHGAVFAEAFKAVPVNSLNQLVTLVNYIHNNPYSAKEDPKTYVYSSFTKYLTILYKIENKKAAEKKWSIYIDTSYFRKVTYKEFVKLMERDENDQFCEGDSELHGKYYMSDTMVRKEVENVFKLKISDIKHMEEMERNKWLYAISLIPGTYVRQISRVVGLSYSFIRNCLKSFEEFINDPARLEKMKKNVIHKLINHNDILCCASV
ncbi:MAG: hypothetical protein GX166_05525 [Clostridiaceae bacterium]|nr:hypothetical protein [Clostridiaceae bacterium]